LWIVTNNGVARSYNWGIDWEKFSYDLSVDDFHLPFNYNLIYFFWGGAGHGSNSGRLDIFCCTSTDITIPPIAENGSIRDAVPHNVFNYYFA